MKRLSQLTVATLLLVASSFSVPGCDSIVSTDAHVARAARVVITGTSPVPLELLTSTDFTAVKNPDTGETVYTLNTSSAETISVPFDRTFQLNGSDRFFVRLTNADQNATAAVRMQVLVDGKSMYDVNATLKDAALKFSYFSL